MSYPAWLQDMLQAGTKLDSDHKIDKVVDFLTYLRQNNRMEESEKIYQKLFPKKIMNDTDLGKAVEIMDNSAPFYVGLVVMNPMDKSIMLGKRKEDGIWTGPGGGANPGEIATQAVIREAFEESRLEIKEDELIPLPIQDTKNGKKCYCFMVYRNQIPVNAENLDPDREVDLWMWVRQEDLGEEHRKDDCRFNTIRNAIMKDKNLIKAIKQKLVGGLADKKKPSDFDPKALKEGTKIEMEHTNDPDKAKEIAMDHLTEDPEYYTKLKTIEKGGKRAKVGEVRTWADGKKYIKRPDGWVSLEQVERELKGLNDKLKEPNKEESEIRKEAEKEVEVQKEDYTNARESKFSNLGEDLKGSARHKRAAYKSIQDAINDSDFKYTSKNLKSQFPIDLISDMTPDNSLNRYVCNQMVERFPSKIKYNTEAEKEQYLKYYKKVTDFIEKNKNEVNFVENIKSLKSELLQDIKLYRASKEYDRGADDFMVNYVNKTLSANLKKGSITNDVNDFFNIYKKDVPEGTRKGWGQSLSNEEKKWIFLSKISTEQGMEISKQLIEGKSLSKIIGTEGTKKGIKKRFKMADVYLVSADRNGPSTGLNSIKKQENFILKDCKIRGLQWGNSVTDGEREHHLKCVAESFKDLSDVLGLPEEMISYNGRLGLAIGARGKAGAMATYNPGTKIINLTRANGVGSLAHEWGHMLDNVLSATHEVHKVHDNNAYLSEISYFNLGGEGEVKKAMAELVNSEVWTDFRNTTIDSVKEFQEKGFQMGKMSYWTSPREMFARAFEGYVANKLESKGRKNTYLSSGNKGTMWMSQEQLDKVTPLFDNFFKALKESDHIKKAIMEINKAKPLPVGTIHEYNGVKYQKTDQGWKPLSEPSAPGEKPELKQPLKPKPAPTTKDVAPPIKMSKKELSETLKSGEYSLISAGINPADEKDKKMTPEQVEERYANLEADLKEAGYQYMPVDGNYDGEEKSFMVINADPKHIEELGTKYNQDSVINSSAGENRMVFTTGENKGKQHIGQGFEEKPDADNYYSEADVGGEKFKFALNFDFDNLQSAPDNEPHSDVQLNAVKEQTTQSGKPILLDFDQAVKQGYTPEDHRDAANFHYDFSERLQNEVQKRTKAQPNFKVPEKAKKVIDLHNKLFKKHHSASQRGPDPTEKLGKGGIGSGRRSQTIGPDQSGAEKEAQLLSMIDKLKEREKKTTEKLAQDKAIERHEKKEAKKESPDERMKRLSRKLSKSDILMDQAMPVTTTEEVATHMDAMEDKDVELLDLLQKEMAEAGYGDAPKSIMLDRGELFLSKVEEGLYSGYVRLHTDQDEFTPSITINKQPLAEVVTSLKASDIIQNEPEPIVEEELPDIPEAIVEPVKYDTVMAERILNLLEKITSKLV